MNTQNLFLLSLMPENDRPVKIATSIAIALGLSLSFWFSTLEFFIEPIFFEPPKDESMAVSMRLDTPKPPQPITPPKKIAPPRNSSSTKKVQSQGNPKARQAIARLNLITSRSQSQHLSAYELFKNSNLNKDLDKVLKNMPRLTQQGTTVLGEPRGKANGTFNNGWSEGGSGGLGDALQSILGGPAQALTTKAIGGKLAPPRLNEISLGNSHGGRSASEIQQVVRARMPGLRHIYNKFLKTNPGLSGKVTLKFTISPSGQIVSCECVHHTTGLDAFAEQIRQTVARWTFRSVASGNTTVSIPFAFTE